MEWVVGVVVLSMLAGAVRWWRHRHAALRDAHASWQQVASSRGLTLSQTRGLRLTGDINLRRVDVETDTLVRGDRSVLSTRLVISVLDLGKHTLTPLQFARLREAIHWRSPGGLTGDLLTTFHESPDVRAQLPGVMRWGALSLSRGELTLEVAEVLTDELGAVLDGLVGLSEALVAAEAAPWHALAEELGLTLAGTKLRGDIEGIHVILWRTHSGHAVRAAIPDFPAQLTVTAEGTGQAAHRLGDAILDSQLVIETPFPGQLRHLQRTDIHGDLLTVIRGQGGRIEQRQVKLTTARQDRESLDAALADAIRLAKTLSRKE